MPIYVRYGIAHAWIIDPKDKTLDIYRLESGRWYLSDSYGERNQTVRAEPFQEIGINLADLWLQSL